MTKSEALEAFGLFLRLNPDQARKPALVSRFSRGPSRGYICASVLPGATPEDKPTVSYRRDEVAAIPKADARMFRAEYQRAIASGDVVAATVDEYLASIADPKTPPAPGATPDDKPIASGDVVAATVDEYLASIADPKTPPAPNKGAKGSSK